MRLLETLMIDIGQIPNNNSKMSGNEIFENIKNRFSTTEMSLFLKPYLDHNVLKTSKCEEQLRKLTLLQNQFSDLGQNLFDKRFK